MNNIRELRKKNEFTQETLADILGVDRSTIAKWETGVADPMVKNIPHIAKVLKCDINEIFAIPDDTA